MLVCLFLMFCFARCIRWRFGLLAPNMRATVFERVRSPFLAFWRFVFTIYFCLMFTFGSFYVLCVFYSFAHVGLTFLFCTVSFLLSFPSVEYKFALLTLSFKNFYIQSHCLPTFFCCFCWSGFFIISFLFFVWILREFDFYLFNFSRVKITVSFALRALGVNFCVVASCKWIVSFDSQKGDLLLFVVVVLKGCEMRVSW